MDNFSFSIFLLLLFDKDVADSTVFDIEIIK